MSGPNFRVPEQLLLPWHPRQSVSVQRVAEILDVSHDTVVRLVEAGAIKAYQLRPRSPYRIFYESLLDYIERVHSDAGLDPRFRR
jgi:excisionase family DNA binding protein